MNTNPIPVPDAVTALKAALLPQYVVDAVRTQADAVREAVSHRGLSIEAQADREDALAAVARANKALATVPARGSLVVRGAA
ncbi:MULTISPECIES: hypothetical protein [Streptomyces]|uniref:Uncharacterized protein n=2 Tax=Streptomyces rimosus subsp. rimosus TaxID=132474 RepID=L8EY59_STRR1|nr:MULTISPECIES: hypothetical protein [Streptomyces]KOG70572.1 hypothetical protein ADK78_28735 [Kitasatospora aureofaciens]MYT47358.1 hypothetical protein [Streptomyces sp. SID5471]KEF04688.1 hypothetical protein DF17_22635 [Streptomyces rimosus]KUJ29474.1 hypothetical protein ADK46_29560 [Streptomyces rimosus subsp. rimosus]QDA06235.1 hypothetical protein CTZ40_23230 [Streptomyces rimosus]